MVRTCLRVAICFVTFGLGWLGRLSSPAVAQVPVHIEIIPQLGYFFFNGNDGRDIEVNEDGLLYGGRFGVVFSKHWAFEGHAGLVISDFTAGEPMRTAHSSFLGAGFSYRLANASLITPLLAAGVEILDMDTTASGDRSDLALTWGGGVDIALSSHTSVRLDGRHHYFKVPDQREPDASTTWLSHFEVAAGLAWKPWK